MRPIVIAGNWKMNLDLDEAEALARALVEATIEHCELVVAPTALCLDRLVKIAQGSSLRVAAQNIYFERQGAFTGELSADHLKAGGVSHTLIGHSERRQLFAESDTWVNEKLKSALRAGLRPIVCVGETEAEREAGQSEAVVLSQVQAALENIDVGELSPLILAYEPVWAIGTGKVASAEDAQAIHAAIRAGLQDFSPELAESTPILYGGSVKPSNAAGLLAQNDIDGALVGGASLKAESFLGIVEAVPR